MLILLKSFSAQIMSCILTYFLYAWMWSVGTNWLIRTMFVFFIVIIFCGYIATGYWINTGKMDGLRPILLIYVLSGVIIIFMIMTIFCHSETRISSLAITNLPCILLLEYQKLIISLHGSKIAYIFSGLFPSVLMHFGFVLKNHILC